ncbi:hypothetical protein JCM8208_001158 [Rhodotorula glutinis]
MALPTQHRPQPTSSSSPPTTDTMTSRLDVINSAAGRILCVADIRGAISNLNALAAEHSAVAIIHSGDFGFFESSSLSTMSDRTLKHLVQYSSLISPQFRAQLLSPNTTAAHMRELVANPPKNAYPSSSDFPAFALSEFPKLLSGEIKLNVPVYTVWGACEDVAILEKIRLAPLSPLSIPVDPSKAAPTAPSASTRPTSTSSAPASYSIPNLTVLDEATTRVLLIGGVRLRLFGLGGAVVPHKLFDNGAGTATIAGGQGTMWTTMLQVGELVDTAQKVYDPSETRLLVTHASPGREGLISQLALVLKADLTVSAGLHFRYGVSYNEFSVQHDPDAFKAKLEASKTAFNKVWESVRSQVESVVNENQRSLLQNALAVANRIPSDNLVSGGAAIEETAWKNCWNWNLPDVAFGSLVLDIRDGRVGSETKSQGFNFAYRQSAPRPPASTSSALAPVRSASPAPQAAAIRQPTGPGSASASPAPGSTSAAAAPNAANANAGAGAGAAPSPSGTPFSGAPRGGFSGANGAVGRPTPTGPAGAGAIGNHPRGGSGGAPAGPRGGAGGRGGFASAPGGWGHGGAQAVSASGVVGGCAQGQQGQQDARTPRAPHQNQGQGQQSQRAPRGQAPHQIQQQQQAQQQQQQQQEAQQQSSTPAPATAATAVDASGAPSVPVVSAKKADTSSATAGDVTAGDEPASPSTPTGEGTPGAGGRGGKARRERGPGRAKGRSNGDWTRAASGGEGGKPEGGKEEGRGGARGQGKKQGGGGGGAPKGDGGEGKSAPAPSGGEA